MFIKPFLKFNNMKNLLFTLFTYTFSLSLFAGGHEIKVKIKGVKDTTIILGHHFANSMYPDDTIKVDKNGQGVFKGNELYPGGMYIVFLPNKNYFDIILDNDQHFSVENDTTDLFKNIKFEGSADNDIFIAYQKFLSDKRDEAKKLTEAKKQAKTDSEKALIADKLKTIDIDVKAYIKKIIDQNPNAFVAKFIKGTIDIEVPDPPKDASGKIIDSAFQYKYYRSHYFDNFDISDPRLLRTPLYESKVKTYIEKVIPQIPDTINTEVDMLINKSRTSTELFRYMLVTLFNNYGQSNIMGFDAVALYIADKYYIKEATWSDTAYLNKLKKQVKNQLPLVIGKKAPEIQLVSIPDEHFKQSLIDTTKAFKRNPYVGTMFNLSALKSKYTILYFWEADCGHCKKTTPIMYDIYNKLKNKDVSIISVSLLFGEDGKEKWINFINEHKLYGWINAWNPYSYKFKELYDITSTPQLFILDSEKRIVAKKIGPEQCEEIINHLIEADNRKK